MLEREQLIELVVAVSVVFIMLGAMVAVGSTYGGDDSVISPDGAELLVGVIVGFIFLLTAVGIGLAFVMNDAEDGLDEDGETV